MCRDVNQLHEAPLNSSSILKLRFRIWLLVFVAALVTAVAPAEVSRGFAKYGGAPGQELLWQSVSRLRVFLALHALAAGIGCLLLGWIGLFLGWSAGRLVFFLGVVFALSYYRLDPRFRPEEWVFLVRALLLIGGGALSVRFIEQIAGNAARGVELWRAACGLCCFAGFLIASNLLAERKFSASSAEIGLSLALFLAGAIIFASTRGAERSLFHQVLSDRRLQQCSTLSLLSSLAAQTLLFIIFLCFVLEGTAIERLLVAGLSPLVSTVGGIYGAYSWFSLSGPPQVFASGQLAAAGSSELSRLYLSLFFQYTTLCFLFGLIAALRNRDRLLFRWIAHLALLLYLLPSIWVLKPPSDKSPEPKPPEQIAAVGDKTVIVAVS